MTWSRQQRHKLRGRPKPDCPCCGGTGWLGPFRHCSCPQKASLRFYNTDKRGYLNEDKP